MSANCGRLRKLRAGLIAAVSAAAITAGAVVAAPDATAAARHPAAVTASAETTATAGTAVRPGSRVPWARVGPGWVLTEYSPGDFALGDAYVYLISPLGTRYLMHVWRPGATAVAPSLIAWSGDKRRALFASASSGVVRQLTLATGRVSSFRLAGRASPIGYTRPSGLNILGTVQHGRTVILSRYSLSGRRLRVLTSTVYPAPLYTSDGAALVVPAASGLKLVSNLGGVIRSLRVPGVSANSCVPRRWWNPATVLASCLDKSLGTARVWLVPIDGGRPVPVTPRRSVRSGVNAGNYDAWRLPGGLYTQGPGPCGPLIFRQWPSGSAALVSVPHAGAADLAVTAYRGQLLIQARATCGGSVGLLWFSPRTRAGRWLLRPRSGSAGVDAAVPYYTGQNAAQ